MRLDAASMEGVSLPVTQSTKPVPRKQVRFADRYAKWKQAVQ